MSTPLFYSLKINAQLVPDTTLGTENSIVIPQGVRDFIEEGARYGSNLFHSFAEFNVKEGQSVYFNNPNGVDNIFTRVTGDNPSNILGSLGVDGTANLFLLNPNGIVFGANAQLDVRGSFIGSTADSIKFADGSEFNATNPQNQPLLTINVPIGLQFGSNPESIINQSTALSPPNLPTFPPILPISTNVGLAVQPGQTLALIGGDLLLNGGNLTANTGQILLGSVASPGLVRFSPTPDGLTLNYDNIPKFGNIELSNGAIINTTGLGGGKVEIRGENVSLNGGRIYALTLGNIDGKGIDINAQTFRAEGGTQISTLTLGNGAGGAVNIRATDSVELKGIGVDRYKEFVARYTASGLITPFDPQILLITGTAGAGVAGDITIDTGQLLIDNGSALGTPTLGAGNGGAIILGARDLDIASSAVNSGTIAGSTGTGGSITIEAERLRVRDGAGLVSITRTEAASGNINIKASESVEVLRTPDGNPIPTFIGTTAVGINGRAGDINIDTKRLIISEGGGISLSSGSVVGDQPLNTTAGLGGNLTLRATESVTVEGSSGVLANGSRTASFISADAYSASPGGSMQIFTPVLTLRNGGLISTASLGRGDAGSITINGDRVEVIGNGSQDQFNSQIQISVGIASGVINPNAIANGGSLNLNVGQLILRNGGTLNLQALGTGQAGNINVVADAIALDNQSSIDGRTASGAGGNINLQAQNILLRRGSQISTDAGNTTGGNITINTNTLVAVPKENSDITANAQQGSGGRISITASGIFGTQFRDRLTPFNDITATSELGLEFNGTVQIDIRAVDPNQGLVELPSTFTDSSNQIVAGCPADKGNSFTVTGRGGIPDNPEQYLRGRAVWTDRRNLSASYPENSPTPYTPHPTPHTQLIEAQDWIVDENGTVTLTAAPSGEKLLSSGMRVNSCQSNENS
ncbi:S-layer family protein [Coleofasciculus sp. LEGE 07092]|uniref:S-layer family protein n=1 Tax=Coleofasciculus sp. LEGE 07092 TaxID=2777969 RepID=UPI002AD3A3C7|nr:S-layer family protein [Coleofasciculus sp. LEGE 07092]